MKCPECGYEIEKPNRKTCPCCGASIKTIIAQPEEEEEQPEPFTQDPDRPEPSRQEVPLSAEPQQVCPRCQTTVPDGFNFCPSCGYDLREPAETEPEQDVPLAVEQEPEIKPGPHRYEPQYTPYQSEPEHYEPEPEHYQPENNDYEEVEEENPVMGGYYPYSGGEEEEPKEVYDDDFTEPSNNNSSMSWLTIVIATIFSLLIGALLYFIFN